MPVSERDKSIQTFFILLKAGLWEKDAQLISYDKVVFAKALEIAEEQSVVGLIAAGVEHITDVKIPQDVALELVGSALQIEQRNKEMNRFVAQLFTNLEKNDISAVLVKGQGVAQCYERPLWRVCGDVDLLLDKGNYEKAKLFFDNFASRVGDELKDRLHQDYTIGSFEVELHGTMRTGLWGSIDKEIDDSQRCVCSDKDVRIWKNGNVRLQLPHPNYDVIFVFTHILQHFYQMGIGLRQICDWCRLLWTYRNNIDHTLLESKLKSMGALSEWMTFAAFANEYLGMPSDVIPFYDSGPKWSNNARCLLNIILETGNFGHNKDMSYQKRYPFLIRKCISVMRYSKESIRRLLIFPLNASRVWWSMMSNGLMRSVRMR